MLYKKTCNTSNACFAEILVAAAGTCFRSFLMLANFSWLRGCNASL